MVYGSGQVYWAMASASL